MSRKLLVRYLFLPSTKLRHVLVNLFIIIVQPLSLIAGRKPQHAASKPPYPVLPIHKCLIMRPVAIDSFGYPHFPLQRCF